MVNYNKNVSKILFFLVLVYKPHAHASIMKSEKWIYMDFELRYGLKQSAAINWCDLCLNIKELKRDWF